MKLYMIRHGESEANRTRCFSLPETPLSERGIQDAESVGRLIRHIDFDRVLVSPYLRARQTQRQALPDRDGETVELLHEVDCGSLEGHPDAEMRARYEYLPALIEVDDFRRFGGENYTDMRRRIRAFMDYAVSLKAERIAAFAHAGVILAFFDEVMQREGKPGRNIRCSNGSVSIFEYKNGRWSVDAMNITEII